MIGEIVLSVCVLWATLMRGLLIAANFLPRVCARCGLAFERRILGEPVCRCAEAE